MMFGGGRDFVCLTARDVAYKITPCAIVYVASQKSSIWIVLAAIDILETCVA